MDFMFTDEQQMLRDGVSRYLANDYDFDSRRTLVQSDKAWSPEVWSQFGEFGLLALPFAESQGGLGGSIADIVAVCELFGEYLVVEPYLGSILLSGRALAADQSEVAGDWLGRIVSGEAIVAFAHEEGRGTADPAMIALNAQEDGDGFTLTGEKRLVLNGAQANLLVVSVCLPAEGGVGLAMVDPAASGVAITALDTIDGRSAAHIRFENVRISAADLLDGAPIEELVATAIIALSAEAVGAMGALLAKTSEYAATRKQFGVAIGSFQAVAHRLADMKIAYTKARSTLLYTTALAESGQATPRDISILKGQIGKLGRAIGEAAIQTHGGVGMTDELSIGHYHKRLLAIDAMFGNREYHLRCVGSGDARSTA